MTRENERMIHSPEAALARNTELRTKKRDIEEALGDVKWKPDVNSKDAVRTLTCRAVEVKVQIQGNPFFIKSIGMCLILQIWLAVRIYFVMWVG